MDDAAYLFPFLVTGTRFGFVPYRGGAPAMQDLMAGRVDIIPAHRFLLTTSRGIREEPRPQAGAGSRIVRRAGTAAS